jgi:nicotinate-nucleotide--dimethylbenzimidazole phosphoribosyltransferase
MSSLARHFGCEVEVVDIGIATPYQGKDSGILQCRIRRGTGNIANEPAMSREEAVAAILVGIERARQASKDGVDVIGVGEMGIGNTTTSSAVLAALTDLSVENVTGRGGGLTDAAFAKKKKVIARALELHGLKSISAGEADTVNASENPDPIDVIAKVGGLDIAAMCGVFLGAALYRLPVVIDGFISIVAALCAQRLCGIAREYMFPSHVSEEIGYMRAAEELCLDPWLHMNMRLGEGSGCPLAFQILEASCALMNEMATFEQAKIDDGYLAELRAMQS